MKKALLFVGISLFTLVSCKKETTNPTITSSTSVNTDPYVITFNPNVSYGSFVDIDGNVYKTVKIAGKE